VPKESRNEFAKVDSDLRDREVYARVRYLVHPI
jgi:hypothetical protein